MLARQACLRFLVSPVRALRHNSQVGASVAKTIASPAPKRFRKVVKNLLAVTFATATAATGGVVIASEFLVAPLAEEDEELATSHSAQTKAGHANEPLFNSLRHKFQLLQRAVWLCWSFCWVLWLSPVAILSPDFCERTYYRLIYEAILYSRSAAFTKWSQWASVRLDLLPVSLCLLLQNFQANAAHHSHSHTLAELSRAGLLGTDASQAVVLEDVAMTALASGSIAQVHKARCSGEQVVVKVRHPHVEEEMLLDFELMRLAADTIHSWIPPLRWLNGPATVEQFETAMVGQCDLAHEASNLIVFHENFKRKIEWVAFPQVIYASSAVLVESFESGVLMSEFVERWRGQELPEEESMAAQFVMVRGEDIYLQMLLVDNFMHADMHPGNILFREQGESGKPQIVMLDAGMAATLTAKERRNFIGLLQAIGDGDGGRISKCVLNFSSRQPTAQGATSFEVDVKTMCVDRCRGYGTGLDPGGVVRELMQLMFRHGVSMGGNYATLIVNMLCIEGLARGLDSNFNVVDVAYPLLRAHQVLGDRIFQRYFSTLQWIMPLPFWEMAYRFQLYAGLHGERLKKFQI